MTADHRIIGNELKLFFFDDMSPGSCFFLPKGAKIYNRLIDFLRSCYNSLGYQEVITPNIYNKNLWKISGHWDKYKENMFLIENDTINNHINKNENYSDNNEITLDNNEILDNNVTIFDNDIHFSLKPMNCPGHCLLYKHMNVSYKDLPIRLADFGVLHRNEFSGALTGLTRVRRFQQDDAHIFCTLEQVETEIENYLHFLETVYNHFNFKFEVELSTRPDKYIGNLDNWNKAEQILESKIKKISKWKINKGDGAFYGPKIDVKIKDSLKRKHQCGTIQLDFNLPERFQLKYSNDNEGLDTPVLIHRAIFGSIERFMAILLEHTNGRLPFWLSPSQISIIPISNIYLDYANQIKEKFNNYDVVVDNSKETLNKKIRNSQKQCFNYIFVVGEKEMETNTINIRIGKNILGTKTLEETLLICQNDYQKNKLF